jgi:ankyrin repeat protein
LYPSESYANNIVGTYLLDKVEKCNFAGIHGFTPLFAAAVCGYSEITKELLRYSEKPNVTDDWGNTALHIAAFLGHLPVVRVLLESDVDPEPQAKDGKTPLHLAAVKGHSKICTCLIKHGAKPNLTDNDGRTPMHYAVIAGEIETVTCLIGHHALLDCEDMIGFTSRMLAECYPSSVSDLLKIKHLHTKPLPIDKIGLPVCPKEMPPINRNLHNTEKSLKSLISIYHTFPAPNYLF